MSELKPRPPMTSDSNSMTVVHSPQPHVPEYGSMSLTVVNAAPITVRDDAASKPSKPLNASAIRVVDSIVRAKVNESAIRRDTSEE